MTLRFTISRALGLAVALSLGSAVSAAAQQPPTTAREKRDERNRVRKETMPDTTTPAPTTATTPMPTSPVAAETGRIRDTVVVQCNCATQQASAGEVIPIIRPRGPKLFGNGMYFGLSGSAAIPVGDLYKAYSEGWGMTGYAGWDHKASPVGLRLSVGYSELNGRTAGPMTRRGLGRMDIINDFGGASADANAWNAELDGKFRVPIGKFKGATSSVYGIAGGGVHYLQNYNSTLFLTNNFYGRGIANDAQLLAESQNESDNATRFGWNAGAGASLGFGNTELFVESFYRRVYTSGRAINYVPLVLGLSVH